ncbi:CatB-related O-acetyltransferase [Thalassobacillus pellis]|uniref:xenobiotic acyltransferase family protein n=1 Tax=Thalassobacillus pellis TaxID=748008 RepID=UPI00195F4C2F|nr:CatB-related O-acetyltransferase [Thalassobacillus pellis]MBM7551667.1 acetyltransferase-like isoleucine patch superfamily enzyme [Thalassobacillus pellis]
MLEKFNISPEIINSNISSTTLIEPFSHVINSELSKNTKIYKQCWIVNSTLKGNTFAGEGSKLDNCFLDNYSRSGKYNHLYYVDFGKHTYTGQNTVIMKTKVGAFSSISWNVTIGAPEHDFNRVTTHTFLYNSFDKLNNGKTYYDKFKDKCEIGNDVWIGANSTILRGANIADGAVVGANSVVTESVPPYAVVVGNPAKIIKFRFNQKVIDKLLEIKWWTLEDELIKANSDLFANFPDEMTLEKINDLN